MATLKGGFLQAASPHPHDFSPTLSFAPLCSRNASNRTNGDGVAPVLS